MDLRHNNAIQCMFISMIALGTSQTTDMRTNVRRNPSTTVSEQNTKESATNATTILLNLNILSNITTTAVAPIESVNSAVIYTETLYYNASNTTSRFNRAVCRDYPIPIAEFKDECCAYQYRIYTQRWMIGSYYLVTILERMKRWGCREFEDECGANPTWPFTEYSRRMYDLFCRRDHLVRTCYDEVKDTAKSYSFIREPVNKSWTHLIETLDSSRMRFGDLTRSCVQVALYDRLDGGAGRFHEVVEPFAPFCGLQWQGYDYNTAQYRDVSPWTGMSIWCRSSIIICVLVMVVAGIATIISNILILAVFGTTERLRNSQAVYKMSLAAADLMVGLVIWPNMIVLQYLTFWQPRSMGPMIRNPYRKTDDMTPYDNTDLVYRYGGGVFRDIFPDEYVRTMGFFTMVGLMVSIYTLMVASFDRFWAVFKPLRYNRFNAKRQAIILCAVLWIISIIVCLLPTFVPVLVYQVISSILINMEGLSALVFLFIALVLPLVISWVVTSLTFHVSRQHARAREKIVSAVSSSSQSLERRLAKTLSIMVGVFTLSLLPAICCTVASFTSSNTVWEQPRNLSISAAAAFTTSEYLAIIILTSNSLWNCIIYSLRTRGFREAASSIMQDVGEMSGFRKLRQGVANVIDGARRVSLSTMINMRRFSTPDSSDSRKKSVTSLTATSKVSDNTFSSSSARPSMDIGDSSVFAASATDNSANSRYTRSAAKTSKATSGVEARAGRKKALKKEESEEYAGDDSTFGSFAINAGTDRLFESVMENVPEEIEIVGSNA